MLFVLDRDRTDVQRSPSRAHAFSARIDMRSVG